jgi:hypothetical protein
MRLELQERSRISRAVEVSAMFTRRVWWWVVGAALALLVVSVTIWVLTPPRSDSRIHLGMTQAEVEAILRCPGMTTNRFFGGVPAHYHCPDGVVHILFKPDQTVADILFAPRPPFWEPFRAWLGW